MASVSKERNTRGEIVGYRVQWREGGGRTDPKQSERFGDEASALKFRDLVNEAGQRWPLGWVKGHGKHGATITGRAQRGMSERASMSVYDWAAHYFRDDNPILEAKASSRRTYRGRMSKRLKGSPFGDLPLHDVTREAFQEWITALRVEQNLSVPYVTELKTNVTSALRAAVFEGVITVDATRGVKVPKGDEDEDTAFQPFFAKPYQIRALIEGTPLKYRLAVRTLAETGLRHIEFSHLTPQDVHHSEVTGHYWLSVNRSKTKSGKRLVTLNGKLGKLLYALAERRSGEARLFDAPTDRTAFYRAAWYPARTAAKLPTMRLHDLRHSHASQLLANGGTLFTVSKRLGHARLQITSDLYGHMSHEDEGLLGILDAMAA